MMIPFYLKSSDIPFFNLRESLWSIQEMKIEDGFLFSHVQQFLQSSVIGNKYISQDNCSVYSLKEDVTMNSFFNETFSMDDKEGNDPYLFKFYTDKDKLLSPKLIICPEMSSGLLILSFKLKGDVELEHLMSFNHSIQNNRDNRIPNIIFTQKIPSGEFEKEKTDSLRKRIGKYRQFFEFEMSGNELSLTFKISQLVSRLLKDVKNYQFVNNTSYHLFTYFQTVGDNNVVSELSNDQKDDIVRIFRKQNKNFHVAGYNYKEHVIQLFGNIYVASSHEGGCMMVVSDGQQFFNNYLEDVFQERFLWLYILAFIQRVALINIQKELAEKDVFDDVQGLSLDDLRIETQRLINMKVNTSFSLVSDYSQHNLFYLFCKEKLGVNDLFDDINDKMKQIDSLLEQKSAKVRERNQGLMSIVILLFALCSAANDATDQIVKMFHSDVTQTAIFTSIVIFVIFVLIAWNICKLFGWSFNKLFKWGIRKQFKK